VKGRRTFLVTQSLTAPHVLFLCFFANAVSHSALTGHYLEQGKQQMRTSILAGVICGLLLIIALAWLRFDELVQLIRPWAAVALLVILLAILIGWLDRRYRQDAVQCDECGRDHHHGKPCVCGAL
jgi:ABC-type Mn2+/Zn2+ transport system permease subunit